MKTDLQLHKDVAAELTWDPRVDQKEIGVAAKDGVVTLTGTVASYTDKCDAENAAVHVAGVKAVANDLVVKIPGALKRTDTELAHIILETLKWNTKIPKDRITARVEAGWVTLEGNVQWQFQREECAARVSSIMGVFGVSNMITVAPKPVSQHDVQQSIKLALERRADNAAARIQVETHDGVVVLKGNVPSFSERVAAQNAAWLAPGVSDVRDELVVSF